VAISSSVFDYKLHRSYLRSILIATFGGQREVPFKISFEGAAEKGGEVVMEFDMPDAVEVAESCGIILHK
jgi:hypothetical protein